MRVGSLFAGIGGFDLGFERAGFTVAWCVEWDKNAQAVLRKRFPNAKVYGDIREVDPDLLEPVDIVCGGFPCQDLSVAGKRAGLAGERSGLFHDAMRIVRRLNPRLLVLENVPGLLSSNRGLDFATVLREVGQGWDCAEVGWRVLDSQYFGVAQRRRRVFVVGSARAGCAEQVLALSEGSCGNPPSRRETREATSADAARCADLGRKWPAEVAPTLNCAYAKKMGLKDQHALNGAGHFVPQVVQGGTWWDGSDTAATLTKQNANGSQRMPDKGNLGAVVQAYRWQNDRDGLVPDDVVGLRASGGSSGFHEMNHPLVAHAFRKSKRAQTAGDDQTWVDDGIANTLNGFDTGDTRTTHIICHRCGHSHDEERICTECGNDLCCDTLDLCSDCLQEDAGKRGQTIAFHPTQDPILHPERSHALGVGSKQECATVAVATTTVVRRLTPVECERLQGFPDGWTNIGTPEKPTADSHRYKQLGNAVTVNVAEWIARRAKTALESDQ